MVAAAGRPIIDSIEAARDWFAPLLAGAVAETLHIVHLDARNHVLEASDQAGIDGSRVELALRLIVADALRLDSSALLIAHNHPSGDPEPSAADLDVTRILVQVTRPLGIALRDHLIFAGERCVSFRQRGLL